MESPVQEQPSLSEPLSKVIEYLYANSRPQFHSALSVLLFAALWTGAMQIFVLLISLTPWFSLVLDYELVGTFAGCLGLSELVRGHVKYWLGYSAEDWCYPAMPIGGAVLGAVFAGLMFLKWGLSTGYEPVIIVLAATGLYPLLGFLFHLQAKQKAKQVSSEA